MRSCSYPRGRGPEKGVGPVNAFIVKVGPLTFVTGLFICLIDLLHHFALHCMLIALVFLTSNKKTQSLSYQAP